MGSLVARASDYGPITSGLDSRYHLKIHGVHAENVIDKSVGPKVLRSVASSTMGPGVWRSLPFRGMAKLSR